MSHTHWCDIAGHPWECESSDCICICQQPMEQSDHTRCSIELKACAEHGDYQFSVVRHEEVTPSGPYEGNASDPPAMRTEREDWVRLQPIAPEIEEKLSKWFATDSESIGFCCLCGSPILTERDIIPGSNYTHTCAEGRLFEEKKRRGK
jgi:hypothetical protein